MNIQPLITTAFSSYYVNRSALVAREADTVRNDTAVGGVENSVNNSNSSVSGIPGTEGVENQSIFGKSTTQPKISDTDVNKPHNADGDVLDLSDAAIKVADESETKEARQSRTDSKEADADALTLTEDRKALDAEANSGEAAAAQSAETTELTPEEQQQLEELKARDAEVRTHEAAHLAAAGPYATSGASYTYQTGPDGQKYAIGGEVSIDVGEVSGDPEATIRKMQTVVTAAMAPAEPSSQDYKVAAAARQTEAKARTELAQQQREGLSGAAEEEQAVQGEEQSAAASDSVHSDAKSKNSGESSESSAIKLAKSTSGSTSSRRMSPQNAAYQAQSTLSPALSGSMTSGQTGSISFSAFA